MMSIEDSHNATQEFELFHKPIGPSLPDRLEDTDMSSKPRNAVSVEGSIFDDSQYLIGLTLLLSLICLGIFSSIFMCVTLRRNPRLWSEVFGGLLAKTNARFPRRVRFAVPTHDVESTESAKTVAISVDKEVDVHGDSDT